MLDLNHPHANDERIERYAVRVVVVDAVGSVLLISTTDGSNPDFGFSWELPGGGINPQESIRDAAVREINEETGLRIYPDDVSEPLWLRDVLYTYRGERRLQHEAVCVAKIEGIAPSIDDSGREPQEVEDHQFHRWWKAEEMLNSSHPFYPRSLPLHIRALLAGCCVNEPNESWD